MLEGAVIQRLMRHGKQLAIVAGDGRTLCVQLGMSGRVQHFDSSQAISPQDHIHARWLLESVNSPSVTGILTFRDPRRFGGLRSFATLEDLHALQWNALGPDAMTASLETLRCTLQERLSESRRPIKSILLDQQVIAGIGNIYADEVCHRARIHPATPGGRLAGLTKSIDQLVTAIRAVLTAAIHAGGSTLRDYVDAEGRRGQGVALHQVYGRAGEPCLTCGSILEGTTISQRSTTWCPRCQDGTETAG